MNKSVSKPCIYKVNGRWYASVKVEGITLLIPGQPTIDSARKRDLYEQENERINRYLADLMRSNKKVEAIKAYRTMTGTGLKEAKDYCDALQTVDQVERDSGVASW